MIYECPHCHAPQEAGHLACPECGAEFDGPVPEDAILPAPAAPRPAEPAAALPPEALPEDALNRDAPAAAEAATTEALPVSEPVAGPLPAAEAVPLAEPIFETEAAPPEPLLQTVRPPLPEEELPYQRPSYQPPSYSAAPAYAPPPLPSGSTQAYTTRKAPASPLPKVLLLALPFVLLLVLVGYLVSHGLDSGADAASTSLPVITPVAPSPAPAPVGSPTVMAGGTTAAADDPRVKWMAGRWQAANTDFYVFNDSGSGSQGSVAGKLPTQDFLWRIVGNQLMLYGAPKDQELRFSVGPDDNTVYLRDSAGKPIQFTRQAEAAKQ